MRALIAAVIAAIPTVAQAKLEIRDVQSAHGSLGPERKSNEYVAGDQVFYRYTMAGVRTDEDGRTRCEMRLTITAPGGKGGKLEPVPLQSLLPLGGDTLPGVATVDLDSDALTGEYELVVEIRDLISKETASFTRKFTCKPPEFAMVRLRFYQDAAGTAPAPAGGLIRQSLFVQLRAVGFDRSKGEIDLDMELTVLDSQGRPLSAKPVRVSYHNEKTEEARRMNWVNFSATLGLNRPGEFVLGIVLTDTSTGKKVAFETPLRVAVP